MKEQNFNDMMKSSSMLTEGSSTVSSISLGVGNTYITGTSTNISRTGIPPYTGIDPASGALVNPYGDIQEFIDAMRDYTAAKQSVNHTDVLDQIDHLVSKLEQTDNDLQLNAVRHLKYAKAYLDKMALEVINERL